MGARRGKLSRRNTRGFAVEESQPMCGHQKTVGAAGDFGDGGGGIKEASDGVPICEVGDCGRVVGMSNGLVVVA